MSTKLTEKEVEALKSFQARTQNVITDLGKIELQMTDLEEMKSQVKASMTAVLEEQNAFFKTIEETYGKGQIDLNTYEFIPQEGA